MKLLARMRAWADRANTYFIGNWRVVPFQPILFAFAFIGACLALTIDLNHPSFTDDLAFSLWITLSVTCPPMAAAAWYLVRFREGKLRYVGFWIRLGADLGQFASVSAFISIVAGQIDPVAVELFAAELFAAAWWFLVALVVRDVWKLVLTERWAAAIEARQAGP